MLDIAVELAQLAGHSLLDRFGQPQAVTMKGDVSNIVTAADTRAEQIIVTGLRQRFPGHSIISEEIGSDLRPSDYTWVVDPLDGTSNYAAGIPWFGVLIALFRGTEPILAVLHTPVNGETYLAEKGSGAERNGQRIHISLEAELHNVLWAYGMDAQTSVAAAERDTRLLAQLLQRVRNVRATNSLIDAAYTLGSVDVWFTVALERFSRQVKAPVRRFVIVPAIQARNNFRAAAKIAQSFGFGCFWPDPALKNACVE